MRSARGPQAGGLGGRVGVYHGECSPAERRRVHHAFLRDELQARSISRFTAARLGNLAAG